MDSGISLDSIRVNKKNLHKQIAGFMCVVTFLVSYQISISSRNYAAAFDIKVCNMGIFISKLISFRSLLTAIGSLSQFLSQKYYGNDTFRKYSSLVSLCLMFNCRLVFFIILYVTKNLALLSYMILNAEALFFGYFQMSLFSYFPEYSSITTLCIFILGISTYLLQILIERILSFNPLSSIKIQFFICTVITLAGIAAWVFYHFYYDKLFPLPYETTLYSYTIFFNIEPIYYRLVGYLPDNILNKIKNINLNLTKITSFFPKLGDFQHEMEHLRLMKISEKLIERQELINENIVQESKQLEKKIDTLQEIAYELEEDEDQEKAEIKNLITELSRTLSNIDAILKNFENEKNSLIDKSKTGSMDSIHNHLSNTLKNLSLDKSKNESKQLSEWNDLIYKTNELDISSQLGKIRNSIGRADSLLKEIHGLNVNELSKKDISDYENLINDSIYLLIDEKHELKTTQEAIETLDKFITDQKIPIQSSAPKLTSLDSKIKSLKKDLDQLSEVYENKHSNNGFFESYQDISIKLKPIKERINIPVSELKDLKDIKTEMISNLIRKTKDLLTQIIDIQQKLSHAEKMYTLQDRRAGKTFKKIENHELTNIQKKQDMFQNHLRNSKNKYNNKISNIEGILGRVENQMDEIKIKIDALEGRTQKIGFFANLMNVFSPFMMIVPASLIKDFLFPGILPYAVLNEENCHYVNIIAALFYFIGALTIFLVDNCVDKFRSWESYFNCIWLCLIPQITILVITLSAIHTKVGFLNVANSTSIIFLMCISLIYFYSVMESTSYVSVANYVFWRSANIIDSLGVLTAHNILGILCNYFFSKLSIGYNSIRLGTTVQFQDYYHSDRNGICFWITQTFIRAFKDIFLDFKLNIRDYI